jgi:hypothetical protein
MLATSFKNVSGIVRAGGPLSYDQINRAAPSVFASAAHVSRSARYAYIPTNLVVDGLRKEGFQPFMACQARTRIEGKQEFTKHMLRFRHVNQINSDTANEIILVNSHDGTSSYQMLAGCFRFVCHNGLICGETVEDFRVRHSGNVVGNIIEGAYHILDEFEAVDEAKSTMQGIELKPDINKPLPVRRWRFAMMSAKTCLLQRNSLTRYGGLMIAAATFGGHLTVFRKI